MKRALIALLMVAVMSSLVLADTLTLDSTETLSTPQAVSMDWRVSNIDAAAKTLVVTYRWKDATGAPIFLQNRNHAWQTWECRNVEIAGENSECIASEDPYPCCTGAGTGTCDDMADTCFSDVFSFQIRSQDVGTSIGIGLRTLIWNQMKQDILTPGNDGEFD